MIGKDSVGFIDVFKAYPEINVISKRLAHGDYLINDKILIERKTLIDFAKSIIATFWQRRKSNHC